MSSTSLVKATQPKTLAELLAAKKRQVSTNRGRLIFAFDATASREATWKTAQKLQASMFEAARHLEVQLAVFRGDRFETTHFEADSTELAKLMSQITCIMGSTDFKRTLQHVLVEHASRPIHAFVLISDTFEEFDEIGYITKLADDAGKAGIPGFFFHDTSGETWRADRVEDVYRDLAKRTGGAFERFDENSTAKLKDLLESVAAFTRGGIAALEKRNSAGARLLLTQLRK